MGGKQKIKRLEGLELNLFTLWLEYTTQLFLRCFCHYSQSGEVEASCL